MSFNVAQLLQQYKSVSSVGGNSNGRYKRKRDNADPDSSSMKNNNNSYYVSINSNSSGTTTVTTTTVAHQQQKQKQKQVLKFIHITKCAGTTVEMICKSQGGMLCGKFDSDYEEAVKRRPPPWPLAWWHVAPQSMHPPSLARLLEQHVFFAVVRNPYSRLISEFYCEWSGGDGGIAGGDPQERRRMNKTQFNAYLRTRLERLRTGILDFSPHLVAAAAGAAATTTEEVDAAAVVASSTVAGPPEMIEGHYIPQYLYLVRPIVRPTITSASASALVRHKIEALNPDLSALVRTHLPGLELICPHLVHIEHFATEFNALMRKYNCDTITAPEKPSVSAATTISTATTATTVRAGIVREGEGEEGEENDEGKGKGKGKDCSSFGECDHVVEEGSVEQVTDAKIGAEATAATATVTATATTAAAVLSSSPAVPLVLSATPAVVKLKYNECAVRRAEQWQAPDDLDADTLALVHEVYKYDFLLGGYDIGRGSN